MKDKLLHVIGSCLITCVVIIIGHLLGFTYLACLYAGLMTALAAGFGKEFGDYYNPYNKWDWLDILANFIGMLFGFLMSLIYA